jgi:hypothetical protein
MPHVEAEKGRDSRGIKRKPGALGRGEGATSSRSVFVLQLCTCLSSLFVCVLTLLSIYFVIYVHFGGLHIPNSPFTVLVTDCVSILSVLTNPTLLCTFTVYFALFPHLLILYWAEVKNPHWSLHTVSKPP